jgi:hypothetical protein
MWPPGAEATKDERMNEKRKRAAPTIDLTATEVPVPPDESHVQAAAAEPAPGQDEASPQDDAPDAPELSAPGHTGKGLWIGIFAGCAGAIAACVVLAGAWYAGLLPQRPSGDQAAQIAALQKQVEELRKNSAPAAASQDVEAFRARLGKIEADIAQLPPGDKTVADRLTSADNAMTSLGVALAALNKRSDDVAAKASQAQEIAAGNEKTINDLRERLQNAKQTASEAVDAAALATMQKRVDELAQSLAAAHAQVATVAGSEKAMRLALSAASLRDAVERGVPYRSELALTKSLGADEKTLAPLDQFADHGVPDRPTLARQLAQLVPAMMKAADDDAAAPEGFFDRLQANAGRLVRIEPVGAPAGDKPAEVLARIEVEAEHADIDAALSDIGKLPERARQKAAVWVNAAAARQKALMSARQVATDAVRALDTQ